ncbi:MAG TPA: MarR family winged helix-turn-helix transcriptional regulator [Streptosporangiaceae bacterium]|jgi:DNA-binding MarR family transcriptional regulator
MSVLTDQDYQNLLTFRTSLRRFQHWSETMAREAGLTPAQHQLLLAVRGHPGERGPSIGDLADYLLLRHHSAGELIDRAEAAGLVHRHADPDDARLARVELTPGGADRLDQLTPAHVAELRNLVPMLAQVVAAWEAGATG